MVTPIVLLAVSFILTFGKTASRLFDRLRIGFKTAVVLQFLLVIAVVLPHVTTGAQNDLALTGVGITALLGVLYLFVRRGIISFPHTLAGVAAALPASVGLYALSAEYVLPEYWLTVLTGLYVGGISFLFARSHPDAFVVCFLTEALLFLSIFLSPLFDAFQMDVVKLSVRTVNGTVYGLFIGLALMNLFKRIRRIYVKNRQSAS